MSRKNSENNYTASQQNAHQQKIAELHGGLPKTDLKGTNLPENDVLLVIPAYNEAENIERVVDEIIEDYPYLDYVVVTDGPTDGTDVICRKRGYNMVELKQNKGLSECFRNGMEYALKSGHEYAVQFDGDGQHRPEYVPSMAKKANEGYDVVMGSRFIRGQITDSHMSLLRRLGSFFIKILIRLKTGVTITDPTCGMRLYSRKIMKLFVSHKGLSPEPDTIALLIKHGAKVAEVPVRVCDRTFGSSYLEPLKAIKYMFRILLGIIKIK